MTSGSVSSWWGRGSEGAVGGLALVGSGFRGCVCREHLCREGVPVEGVSAEGVCGGVEGVRAHPTCGSSFSSILRTSSTLRHFCSFTSCVSGSESSDRM